MPMQMGILQNDDLPFPRFLPELRQLFPNNEACVNYLQKPRLPTQFVCPHWQAIGEALRFVAKPSLMQCRKCLSNSDLTIAIVMERSHPPFSIWFWAAYLLSHQRHGMSAEQFQRQLGLKRYETAFQIVQKLRAAVTRPALDRITWLRRIHHPVSHHHIKADLNEFKFRFNRRVYPFNAFRSLLDIAGEIAAPTYADFYSGEWFHPSFSGPERATTGYLRLQ